MTIIENTIDTKNGEAEIIGNIYNINSERLSNWLSVFGDESKVVSALKNQDVQVVAILKSIFVPEKERNKGIGNKLMDKFFDQIDDVDVIVLEVDQGEDNKISLEEWYEGYGFEKLNIENFENFMFCFI